MLSDVEFNDLYFSPRDDVVNGFFIPALEESTYYDRASGYFTSSSLVEISVGVCSLASRHGKIRVITSPNLSLEDIEAIRCGYDIRNQVGSAMVRTFSPPDDEKSINRLKLVSELIACGILEIKVAIMRNLDDYPNAIFHPKFGIMEDSEGYFISFTGSMNETRNGLGGNWETLVVSSCKSDLKKAQKMKDMFDDLWNNCDESVFVIDIPEVVDKLISNYRTGELNLGLDMELSGGLKKKQDSIFFKSPGELKKRTYQEDAIDNWMSNGCRGIFNMATGTGKTKTALCALEELYNRHPDQNIFTIVVAPQKHLVDQWAEEIKAFGVIPLVGHSDSINRDWKESLKRKLLLRRSKPTNLCLVTTISSFSSEGIQDWIKDVENLALVLDEAHNMGSDLRLTKLPPNAKYRLALSATIERHGDARGTEALRSYFGEECINLPLESVIGKYLTNYCYYPIVCSYDDLEYAQFIESNERLDTILSNPLSTKADIVKAKNDYIEYSYTLNIRMKSKYDALKALLSSSQKLDHFLIYCGKAKIDSDIDLGGNPADMIDSIDRVIQIVGKKGLGLDVSRITYREDSADRRRIIDEFDKGDISGIVAISCLDEGVDVPSITTAFFMSSSNNPREYIQRRGRVLRLHPNKDVSEIYDMVVLPKSLSQVTIDGLHSGLELKMIAKEVLRMKEFSRVSLNPLKTESLFKDIEYAYGHSIGDIIEKYGDDGDGGC